MSALTLQEEVYGLRKEGEALAARFRQLRDKFPGEPANMAGEVRDDPLSVAARDVAGDLLAEAKVYGHGGCSLCCA